MAQRRSTRVAVVGAGISGATAAAHLHRAGLQVTVFERSSVAGGVWHYDQRVTPEVESLSTLPSAGDYYPTREADIHDQSVEDESGDEVDLRHAPRGPCYAGLKNNVSTRLMRTKLMPWPEGTEDFVNHEVLESYIQHLAQSTGIENLTEYNTRVEEIQKTGSSWRVRTLTLLNAGSDRRRVKIQKVWDFDVVVVASGHYNACKFPDTKGLAEWKSRWPSRVQHSKSYRNPNAFKDKNVLLIGAGVSSTDIARELGPVASKIYQSSRGGVLDLPASYLPPEATRIDGIVSFDLDPDIDLGPITDTAELLSPSQPLPGTITLALGGRLCDIHHIIVCTGYHTSYPFLPQYHTDTIPATLASPTILVTSDGSMVHNLHKDIFYIPDPTLAFVGAPYHVATFSLFEFQAITLSRVFAGLADLPSEGEMRSEYEERVRSKGLGRDFHSLRGSGQEEAYVRDLVTWVNRDAARKMGERVEGHTKEWLIANSEREEKLKWLRASVRKHIDTDRVD